MIGVALNPSGIFERVARSVQSGESSHSQIQAMPSLPKFSCVI